MHIEPTEIPDVILFAPQKFGDSRGYFMETFRLSAFTEYAGPFTFVQENQSLSAEVKTVRGLHFQLEPRAQGKLVRCIAGALLDVAVDIRTGSLTFGKHVAVELTAENARQLWVPPGFAHGFCTLLPNTQISYKVTDYYSPEDDRGLRWDDPALNIKWPLAEIEPTLSNKDKTQPLLAELGQHFIF